MTLASISLLLPAALAAQAAAPAAPADASATKAVPVTTKPASSASADADSIELNPFEVVASRDDGFMATNAGTATKLGLDMNDMAAPYSVMTGEFLKAMGITDVQQAAIWSTNSAQTIDGQGADLFGGSSTSSPSSMYFNRGSNLNAGQQRNFFLTAGLGDTYNIERIDFGRGPNAVLFNVGANEALGGGISTQGKRARLDADVTTLATTVGSWDYYRSTLDVNRPLSPRAAVRVNAVWQKRNGWQQQEFENRKGLTLAGTFRIRPRTELRVEVVNDRTERSRVPVPYNENVSGWDGSTAFDGRISNAMLSSSATPGAVYGLTYSGSPQGVFREGSNRFVYDPLSGTVMNWIHTGYSRAADEDSRTPLYSGGVVWTRNGNNELLPWGNRGSNGTNRTPANNSSGGGQASFSDSINLPADRFDRVLANSKIFIPDRRFSMMPDTPLFVQKTQDANFGFTHQFSDELFLEVQGDVNRVQERSIASHLNFRLIYLDLNRNMPNGSANPHFLDGFSESDAAVNYRQLDNAALRAYFGYIKDLGKWGHYTFNASLGYSSRDVKYRQNTLTTATAIDPREWHAGAQKIRLRYYMGDSYHPFFEAGGSSLYNVTPVNNGNSGYTTSSSSILPRWVLQNWEDRSESSVYGIFAFAGKYFGNKLIVSPGVRVSEQRTYIRQRPTSWAFLPNDTSWDGVTLTDAYWRPDAPANWATLRSGNRPTSGGVNDVNPANPTFANVGYKGDYNAPRSKKIILNRTAGLTYHVFDWMSVKLSYGDNYKPADPGRLTLEGLEAEPETGTALEGGLSFNLFKGRLNITPRYYINKRSYVLSTPGTTSFMNSLLATRAWNNPNTSDRNPFDFTEVLGQDYVNTTFSGYEIEVAGRLTRGWRVSGSLGTTKSRDFGRWPNTQSYVLGRTDELVQVLEAAGGLLDRTQKPSNGSRTVSDAPGLAIANPAITDAMIVAAGNQTSLRTNAIQNFNNLWAAYDTIATFPDAISNDRISAKLVTDYTFQSGLLKGLRLGTAVYYVDNDVAGFRSGDSLPNPNYNPNLPVTSTNRPWMDDPIDPTTPIYVKRPFEVRGTIGYTLKLKRGPQILQGREIDLQLNIINLLNTKDIYYSGDGVALRAPNGDLSAPNRVAVPSRIGAYQRPMSFEFTATLKL